MDGQEPGQPDIVLARLDGGSRLAGYRLEERIGAGGMAVVFRARDERLDRTVALKVLMPALAADEGFRERFLRESRAAAAVDDPHIVPVHEAGEADGVLFIAMRFVAGGDLRAVLRREGPLPAHRAAAFVSPVASALDAAHAAGLVHRDVKPANILVDTGTGRPEHVYLSDFGLSKGLLSSVSLTGTGHFIGTPDYSAPEQVSGRAVDGRADQYALACVAFTLLTGQPPFARDQPMAVLWAHMSEPPALVSVQRPDLPATADQVLARALAKAPESRFGTCGEFAEALREALGVASYTAQAAGPAAITGAVTAQERPAAAALTQTAGPVQAAQAPDEAGGSRVPPRRQRRRWHPGVAVAAGVVVALAGGLAALLVNSASHGPPATAGRSGTASRPTSAPASTVARQGETVTLAARLADPGGGGVVSAGFAPGGEMAAIDANGRTYLWNTATRHVAATLTDPGNQGTATASLGRGGRFAVMAGRAGATYAWDIVSRHLMGTLPGLSTRFVLISPEGDTVATEDANRDGIALTDATQGNQEATLTDPDRTDLTTGAALSPDASTLAVNDDSGRTYLWDTVTRTMIATWKSPGGAANSAAFSPDGKTLADTAGAGKVYLWDIPSHRLAGSVPIPGRTRLVGMAISPDGKLLAEVSGNGDKVYLWDMPAGQEVAVITDPGGTGTASAAFSPDGKTLAVGDGDGSTYLWSIQPD